ncbi:hypothetical protein ABIE89_009145 [Bradyrhizobium niftali]
MISMLLIVGMIIGMPTIIVAGIIIPSGSSTIGTKLGRRSVDDFDRSRKAEERA